MTSERRLVIAVAIHQLICWGTVYSSFPAFLAPMEAELGWSRAAIAGAFSTGLLASGIAAIPAGRWVDRHGSGGLLTLGAALGVPLLVAWSLVDSLVLFYALWIAIGISHAMCLTDPAYALVAANTRDPRRAITHISFVTGFCTAIFLPFGALLVENFGWRAALLVFAGLQLVPVVVAATMLRGLRGSLSGAADRPGLLRAVLRNRVFWALTVAACGQVFVGSGVMFHMLPFLDERGLALGLALVIIALHGPIQVASRLVLVMLGPRGLDSRPVGLFGFLLLPPAMAVLAVTPTSFGLMLVFALLFGISGGLVNIVRATAIVDLLGREGYGQISAAMSTGMVLSRIAAPLSLSLLWDRAGNYDAMPWLLTGVATVAGLAFLVAVLWARRQPPLTTASGTS
ncbi:MFS transporter [Roseomonas sp. AR75]|uniref:MFS transporter n=1 Tax=Roseomonas sp. AR75 TaxID=2562311 RepID=UPI0010C14B87|nr:MFS transporter [Roseomonas sp. AR75]